MSLFNLLTTLVLLLTSPVLTIAAPGPKRGLPFNDPPTYVQKYNGPGSQIKWAYSWGSYMHPQFPSYLEFVPMLWGNSDIHTRDWSKNVNNALARGTKNLLAFNEPNYCNAGVGSCMSPQDAVNAYRKHMMPFANRAALGAPAVSNGPNGLPWLKDFLRLCNGCKIDFIPIHWYDRWDNHAYLRYYIEETWKLAGGRKIWITEFNARGTREQQKSFLRTVMPYLDNHANVVRYSWFWANPNFPDGSLVDKSANPTDLGRLFGYQRFGRV